MFPASHSKLSFCLSGGSYLLQKPLTKVALLVIATLFAGAAIGAHFGGLGISGIVGFGAVSVGAIALLALSLARTCPKRSQKKPIQQSFPQSEHKPVPVKSLTDIQAAFKKDSEDTSGEVVALQQLFDEAQKTHTEEAFITQVIEEGQTGKSLNAKALILERLRGMKAGILLTCLKQGVLNRSYFLYTGSYADSNLELIAIRLRTDWIFGNDPTLPLAGPLGEAIAGFITEYISKKMIEESGIQGYAIVLENECPIEFIGCLLPYLKNIPHPVEWNMIGAGLQTGQGFRKEHLEDLLDLLNSPKLLHLSLNFDKTIDEESKRGFFEKCKELSFTPSYPRFPLVRIERS